MAQEMTGLFGTSPYEVQQARQQQTNSDAADFARMSATQRGVMGIYKGGAGLASTVAGMMGMVDPAVANAQRTEQVMGQDNTDLSSSAGMLAKAEQFRKAGDLRTATALALKGNEMRKQESAAALAQQKQNAIEAATANKDDLAERRFQEAEKVKIVNEAKAKADALAAKVQMAKDTLESGNYNKEQQRMLQGQIAAGQNRLGMMMAEIRRMGIEAKISSSGTEKPMTPIQVAKQQQLGAKSAGVLRSMDDDLSNMTSQAKAISNHPSLWRSTGVLGVLPSAPGGGASEVDGLIDEFRASVKKTGLNLARQGGGIGSMTEKEWPIVEGMVASIKPSAGGKVLNDQMDKVLAKIDQIRQNAYQTHNEAYGDTREPKAITPNKPVGASSTPKRIKFDANGNMVK